jgi:hypothetical protein
MPEPTLNSRFFVKMRYSRRKKMWMNKKPLLGREE